MHNLNSGLNSGLKWPFDGNFINFFSTKSNAMVVVEGSSFMPKSMRSEELKFLEAPFDALFQYGKSHIISMFRENTRKSTVGTIKVVEPILKAGKAGQ